METEQEGRERATETLIKDDAGGRMKVTAGRWSANTTSTEEEGESINLSLFFRPSHTVIQGNLELYI